MARGVAALLALAGVPALAAEDLGSMADRPAAEWLEAAGSLDGSTVAFLNAKTITGLGGGQVRYEVLFNMAKAEPVTPRLAETYSSYVVTYEAACDTGRQRMMWSRLHARRGAAGAPLHAFAPPGQDWATPPAGSIAEELMRGVCDTIREEDSAATPPR